MIFSRDLLRVSVVRTRFGLPAMLLALAACASGDDQDASPVDEKVTFEGAELKSDSDLLELVRRDMQRYEADRRLTALDDAAYRIEYQYRLEGFDRIKVVPRATGDRVIFKIDEGPRIHLGHVRFEGATVFTSAELAEIVPGRILGDHPPYSLRLVLLIEEGVIAAYQLKGYSDVVVTRRVSPEPDKNGRISVWFTIDEGKPYWVTEIRGLPSEANLLLKTADYVGRPFTPGTGETLEATIVDYYRDHGHPFATARTKAQPDHVSGTIVLEVDVRPGPGVRIGEKNIRGTVWSRSSFVENRVDIPPEKEYRVSDLRRAEERLIATNVYKRARVSPGPFHETDGTVPLEIELEERETGEASLRGGYGSFEGVRLGAGLSGVNIWGGAETVTVSGTFSKVGYRGDADLGIPYLFGSELRLGFNAYYESREYPSYDARSQGYVVAFTYPILRTLSATAGLRHANIITTNVDPSIPPGDRLDFNYTAPFFTPTLDLRDNALDPTEGILVTSEVSATPGTRLSDIQFWSASGRFSYFFPFPEGIVFATSFQGGVIAPIHPTNEIPISLREFCGGTNTVRGYKFEGVGPKVNNNPTGGEVFLCLQSEVRFPIWGSLQGAVFTDQGGVWFDRKKVNMKDIRYSVGAGLRFVTPAGALVADVGVNPHPRSGEHPVELHLSVGFPF